MIPDSIIRTIRTAKFFTVMQLATWLNCSVPTARRRLKKAQACTSYNENGRYYTLPSIPKFDAYGLWRYRGVFFSKHGNLKRTVVHLITHSDFGWTAVELEPLIGLKARSFLSHFRDHPLLCREKVKGRFVWFAAAPDLHEKQRLNRMAQEAQSRHGRPSDSDAVLILVDFIRHPNSSIEQMTRRLKRQGRPIASEAIRGLLIHHDLLKKTQLCRGLELDDLPP